MSTYKPPRIEVRSIVNNRIINIPEDVRIPVVVGVGPSEVIITDEAVARSSGSLPTIDRLANHHVTVTKVAPYPGASGSYSPWDGNYGWCAGTNSDDLGAIFWGSGSEGTGRPRQSDTYYVSYTYPVPSTQFSPQLFTDSGDIEATYGEETAATAALTIAAKIVIENGAPAVMCQQLSGSATSSTVWSAALDKLKKKSDISYVVPINTAAVARSSVFAHCLVESAPVVGHERRGIFGLQNGATPSDHIEVANSLSNKRAVVVSPSTDVTRDTPVGTTLTLDGSYVAAAVAGSIAAQERPRDPITGKVIVGVMIPDDQYEPYDMNRMGNAGICVLYAKSGILKCRHAITTDTTSADTEEISVVDAEDYVIRITRNKLDSGFLGKGIVIEPSTPYNVVAAVKAIWNQLVRDRQIYAYGTKTDPTTGEVPITAQVDSSEPRRINVTGSIKYLYPLNYINVSFYVYI